MPSSDAQSTVAVMVAASVIWSLVAIGMYVWLAIALSQLFPLWGREAWKGWVPFVNAGELLSVGGYPAWQVVFLLIPIVNIYGLVILIVAIHRITTRMGHSGGMTVVGVLIPPLWATLLARGEASRRPSAGPVMGAVPRPPAPPAPPAPAAPAAPASASPPEVAPPAPVMALAEPSIATVPATTASASVPVGAPAPTATAVPPAVPPAEPTRVEPAESPASAKPIEPAGPATGDIVTAATPEVAPRSIAAHMGDAPEPTAAPEITPSPSSNPWAAPASTGSSAAGGSVQEPSPWAPSSPAVSQPPEPGKPSEPAVPAIVAMPAFLSDPPPSATTSDPAPHVAPSPPEAASPAVDLPPAPPAAVDAADPAPSPFAPIAVLPAAAAHEAAQEDDDEEYGETVVVDRRPTVRWNLMVDGAGPMRLTADHVLLGRRPSTSDPRTQALAVPDSTRTLSKVHARLDHADDVWTITDLNSTNGVMLVAADGTETLLEAGATARVVGRFVLGEVGMSLAFEDGR